MERVASLGLLCQTHTNGVPQQKCILPHGVAGSDMPERLSLLRSAADEKSEIQVSAELALSVDSGGGRGEVCVTAVPNSWGPQAMLAFSGLWL